MPPQSQSMLGYIMSFILDHVYLALKQKIIHEGLQAKVSILREKADSKELGKILVH